MMVSLFMFDPDGDRFLRFVLDEAPAPENEVKLARLQFQAQGGESPVVIRHLENMKAQSLDSLLQDL